MESGFFALAGTLLGGLVTYFVQKDAQRKENERALMRMAYDAAMTEWRTLLENKVIRSEGPFLPKHFIDGHLSRALSFHRNFPGNADQLIKFTRLAEERLSLAIAEWTLSKGEDHDDAADNQSGEAKGG